MFGFNKVQPLPTLPVQSNAQNALGRLGRHKVEIIAATLTVVSIAIAATTIVLTGGTSSLMYGAILGGIFAGGGVATAVSGLASSGYERLKEEAEKQKLKKTAPSPLSRIWSCMNTRKAKATSAICMGLLVAAGAACKGYQMYNALPVKPS